jgi:hypothetical protein
MSISNRSENMTARPLLASVLLGVLFVGSANAGPCANEIANLTKSLATKDAGSGPTPGAQASANQRSSNPSDQHPPNTAMREQTEGKATSPEDVRRQNTGQPTVAQPGAANTTPDNTTGKGDALKRARMLDAQGKEAECMQAIREAKQLR